MSHIRELRERRGLTQEDLARLMGLTSATVSRWERGSNLPRLRMRKLLARRLGVTVEELELDEPEPAAEKL